MRVNCNRGYYIINIRIPLEGHGCPSPLAALELFALFQFARTKFKSDRVLELSFRHTVPVEGDCSARAGYERWTWASVHGLHSSSTPALGLPAAPTAPSAVCRQTLARPRVPGSSVQLQDDINDITPTAHPIIAPAMSTHTETTLASLLPTLSFLLTYMLPVFLFSLLLTFAGMFLTLDRT